MYRRFALLMLLFGLLVACAAHHPKGNGLLVQGKMLSLKDGNEIHIEIENYANGKVLIATNQATGEHFKGNYGIMNDGGSSTGVITNAYGFKTGQINTNSSKYTLKGMLVGDKGTIINVQVYLGQALVKFPGPGTWDRYRFFGEATDNTGIQYQIYMSGEVLSKAMN